jgi:DNA-binding PadR family transcriptional regulator
MSRANRKASATSSNLIHLADPRTHDEMAPMSRPPREDAGRPLTDSDYVVLGCFLKFPEGLHGYRLKQVLGDPAMGLGHITYSRLYRFLQRFERDGLLHRQLDRDAARLRYSFTITPRGEARFLKWLSCDPAAGEPSGERLLRRLCFADATAPDTVQHWIEEAAAVCARQLAELERDESTSQDETYRSLLRARLRAERQWIEQTRRIFKKAGGARSHRIAGGL